MLVAPAGLRTDPAVEGTVTATFAIDRNGIVSSSDPSGIEPTRPVGVVLGRMTTAWHRLPRVPQDGLRSSP